MPPLPAYVEMGEENVAGDQSTEEETVGRLVLLVIALVLFHIIACVSFYPACNMLLVRILQYKGRLGQ